MHTSQWLLILLMPVAGGLLAALLPRNHWARPAIWLATPFITVVLLIIGYLQSSRTGIFAPTILFEVAPGLPIGFALEPLGLVFAGLVSFLWPVSILYTLAYFHQNRLAGSGHFFFFFNTAIAATYAIALADNLFTMFIAYEVLTLSTYPLVTHKRDGESRRGGNIYLAYLLGSSFLLLLPAIIWLWSQCGHLNFLPHGIAGGCVHPDSLVWLLPLLVFGFAKAALFPLHAWLPAAMVAPAPVSALLHAVAVVKAGVFAIIKTMLYVLGFEELEQAAASEWLVYLAGFSVVFGAAMALRQTQLKRMLAYSTVSQLSYIVMGSALLKPALLGAMLHLCAHACGKIILFFAAGAIESRIGHSRIASLGGIGRTMPWTMACFAVAALSMIGLPPFGGFISKWFLLEGALSHQHYYAIAVVAISTVFNVLYFFPLVYRAFAWPAGDAKIANCSEAPSSMLLPMLLPGAALLLFFFFAEHINLLLRSLSG